MDPKEIYSLLYLLQKIIFWSFFTIFPIVAVLSGLMTGRRLSSFLIHFDEKHNLTEILPTGINVFMRGKKYKWEVIYGKARILNALARYYLKPYWTSTKRQKNELLIEKYKIAGDPYFLACCNLLDKKDILNEKEISNDLNYRGSNCKQKINQQELAKFLMLDRGESIAIWGTALIIFAVVCYKYIIPGLKNYYWGLIWGF